MPFSFEHTAIPGLVVVTARIFGDDRGFFMESYKQSDFQANGIGADFVQDNHSRSAKGVVRGLHFQKPPKAQAKLVRVVSGAVWDVAVDLRTGSPSYLQWHSVELTEENGRMFFIPEGFAHGFVALTDGAQLVYKCSVEYDAAADGGVRWDDPRIGVDWPVEEPLLSPKDSLLPLLDDLGRVF